MTLRSRRLSRRLRVPWMRIRMARRIRAGAIMGGRDSVRCLVRMRRGAVVGLWGVGWAGLGRVDWGWEGWADRVVWGLEGVVVVVVMESVRRGLRRVRGAIRHRCMGLRGRLGRGVDREAGAVLGLREGLAVQARVSVRARRLGLRALGLGLGRRGWDR